MVEYKHNEPYYRLQFSELPEDTINVLSFEGEENISRLFEYRFELLSDDPELEAVDILNKPATFLITREDEPIEINGIISCFEQRGRTPDYVSYYAVLVPKMWRLGLNFSSKVFQSMDIEKIVTSVLEEAGLAGDDFEFQLNESYPELEYCVQYRETDFDFINRRLEHFGIYYYFDHRDGNDVIIFTDSIDNITGIEQEDDILYNENKDPLSEQETVKELTCKEKVVTGLFKLKDYNYEFPDKDLQAEKQLDSEAPGTFYDYGDHFKDEGEGSFLAKVRNEEILCTSKIFHGKSDCRLFRVGMKYKLGEHYREEWNDEFILTRLKSRGTQRGLFAILSRGQENLPTYENVFESIPADKDYRPPRITPIPRLPGIMTARLESGTGDEYAFIDDQGRYKMKNPFDLGDATDGEASRPVRLAQPYSGPGFGVHFPNHADTEIVWACIDGNIDRPLGLGTVPNPSNASPSIDSNKPQSVIRTAGQNELIFDDSTGNENIIVTGTKDNTINITNDRNETVGNNESVSIGNDQTHSVGNDRTRDVGNNETISVGTDLTRSVGSNESISIGSNRDKTVGGNQSENVSGNKDINVGGNHGEQIGGSMSQNVGAAKDETIAVAKTLSIGAAYSVDVGAAMNETIGAAKMEEIGAIKSVSVGANSSEDVGGNKSVDAGGNISESAGGNFSAKAGKDFSGSAGKKMSLSSGDDFAVSGGKKGVIDIKDQLTLKCGSASITMKKNGDITINGKKINIKGSGNIIVKGKKVLNN